MVEMKEPYVAGFLAFREVDFLLERLKKVKEQHPQHYPQVNNTYTIIICTYMNACRD